MPFVTGMQVRITLKELLREEFEKLRRDLDIRDKKLVEMIRNESK